MAAAEETTQRKGTIETFINVHKIIIMLTHKGVNEGKAEQIIRSDYANLLWNEKKKPILNCAKNDKCTLHILLPTLKKEEFLATDNVYYSIDKTAPT